MQFPALAYLAIFSLVQGAITGQKSCNSAICLTGTRDSSQNTDTFTIGPAQGQTLPESQVGWLAMGFGDGMVGSPMVIMWPNSDGSITLSQRMATSHSMPTVVSNPPRTATLLQSKSFSNSTSTSFSFTVPSSSDNQTSLIWATSSRNPGSSNTAASIVQHDKMGVMQVALLATVSDSSSGSGSTSGPGSDSNGDGDSSSVPGVVQSDGDGSSGPSMALYAHVSFAALGTMLFLPLGVLTPRYARAFTVKRWWFPTHSALNGILGAVCVIVAFSIARNKFGDDNFSTTHMKCGLALFILVLIQVFLGIITHWIRHPVVERTKVVARRGPLNFFHVVLGLAILALGWVTVYEGLYRQWAVSSGSGPAGRGYKIAYAVLVGIFGFLYLAGLLLLPRQMALEREKIESNPSTPPKVPRKDRV